MSSCQSGDVPGRISGCLRWYGRFFGFSRNQSQTFRPKHSRLGSVIQPGQLVLIARPDIAAQHQRRAVARVDADIAV